MLRFTQIVIRVGGIVQWFLSDRNHYNVPSLSFHIRNKRSPVHTKHAHIGFAASSSPSLNDKETFKSLIDSFYYKGSSKFQLEELLHHFDTFINANGERGSETKLIMTFESNIFRKDSISGCIALMDKLGIRTTDQY